MQQKEEQLNMPDDEINLADYWFVIRRRKTMIITLCVVSVLAALIISLLLPKYYQSQAVILAFAPESGGLGAALSANPLAGVLTGSLGGLSTPADRLLVYLKSRTIAESVIKRFDLVKVFNERKWDAEKKAWKNPEKPPLLEDAVRKLGSSVTSFKKGREGAITITVEWKDPKLAADIANYYIAALAEFMKDKSVNTTVQIIDRAVPAEKKSRPLIGMNMALTAIISILIGIFFAFFLEKQDKRRS